MLKDSQQKYVCAEVLARCAGSRYQLKAAWVTEYVLNFEYLLYAQSRHSMVWLLMRVILYNNICRMLLLQGR